MTVVVFLLGVGSGLGLFAGYWMVRPTLVPPAAGPADPPVAELGLAAMTVERNSWRERAQNALHVASMPPRPCNPECAECRAARERRT